MCTYEIEKFSCKHSFGEPERCPKAKDKNYKKLSDCKKFGQSKKKRGYKCPDCAPRRSRQERTRNLEKRVEDLEDKAEDRPRGRSGERYQHGRLQQGLCPPSASRAPPMHRQDFSRHRTEYLQPASRPPPMHPQPGHPQDLNRPGPEYAPQLSRPPPPPSGYASGEYQGAAGRSGPGYPPSRSPSAMPPQSRIRRPSYLRNDSPSPSRYGGSRAGSIASSRSGVRYVDASPPRAEVRGRSLGPGARDYGLDPSHPRVDRSRYASPESRSERSPSYDSRQGRYVDISRTSFDYTGSGGRRLRYDGPR